MERVTEDEAQAMRTLLHGLFGPQVQNWNITCATYEALGALILRSGTRALHVVPRPYDFSSPLKWAQKQARQPVTWYFASAEGRHSLVCMRTAALKMKAAFWQAQYAAF